MQYLTVQADTKALWKFNGDLTDSSGNGLTLTMEHGSASYATIAGSVQGIQMTGTQNAISAASALLQLTGDMTIDLICNSTGVGTPAGVYTYVQCEKSGAGGILYAFYHSAGGLGNYGQSYADQGLNKNIGTPNPPGIQDTPGTVEFWSLVRKANVVTLYRNGVAFSSTLASTAGMTAGGTEVVRIGGFLSNPNYTGILASVRISNTGHTAAQVAADSAYVFSTPTAPLHTTASYITDYPLHDAFYYLKITGLPYYFFSTIDPTDAKWGGAQWSLPAGYTSVKGMDPPATPFDQQLPDLIGGIATAERITLSMADFDVVDSTGHHTFFGGLLSPGYLTTNTSAILGTLTADFAAGATGSMSVRGSGGAFSAQDTFIGGETVGVSGVSGPDGNGNYTLTVSTRNKYPCNDGYPPQPNYFVPLDSSGAVIPDQTVLVTQGAPLTFVNRSAALYIGHMKPDGTPEPESNALCRMIGHVKGINYGRNEPGKFEFVIESVISDIKDAKIAPYLAHGDLAHVIHLAPKVWRSVVITIRGVLPTLQSAETSVRFVLDNSGGNDYSSFKDLEDTFNLAFAANGPLVLDFSSALGPDFVFKYTVSIYQTSGDNGKSYAAFLVRGPVSPAPRVDVSIGFDIDDPNLGLQQTPQNAKAGLISVLGFPPATIKLSPGQAADATHGQTFYAVSPRSIPIFFAPTGAISGGVTMGFVDSDNGSARRFFSDQGDGSSTAFVRFGDGQVARITGTTPTAITVGVTGTIPLLGRGVIPVTDAGTFYYVEDGESPTVDQVIRVPSGASGSDEKAMFQFLASKGYSGDGDFNVFPAGVGLGFDGILDKTSLRAAAFKFTSAFLVDVDATMTFNDLWSGVSKEQGMFLVWDPALSQISLRVLTLANYITAVSPDFTESNRAATGDRSQATTDTTNLRTGWVLRYGWDPIQKKFLAPELAINDSFASQAYQVASRTETIEDKTIPLPGTDFVTDTVVPALFSRSIFTRYPWTSVTRSFNKTGLLISPGQYHRIVDSTLINPFTRQTGIASADNVFGWVSRVQSVLATGLVTVTFLIDQTTDGSTLRPWAPTGLLKFGAANNGYSNGTGICTMDSWFNTTFFDGYDFVVGDKISLTTYDNDGAPAYVTNGTVTAVAADGSTVTIDAGLGAVSSTRETIMVLQDWSSQTTDRKSGAHRAAFQGSGDSLLISSSARLHKWG